MMTHRIGKSIEKGKRKVVMTQWSLVIFTVVTLCYMMISAHKGWTLPGEFYMNFMLGLSAITGAFSAGNIFEHRYNALIAQSKFETQTRTEESSTSLLSSPSNHGP